VRVLFSTCQKRHAFFHTFLSFLFLFLIEKCYFCRKININIIKGIMQRPFHTLFFIGFTVCFYVESLLVATCLHRLVIFSLLGNFSFLPCRMWNNLILFCVFMPVVTIIMFHLIQMCCNYFCLIRE
jgi:hypothetical protein